MRIAMILVSVMLLSGCPSLEVMESGRLAPNARLRDVCQAGDPEIRSLLVQMEADREAGISKTAQANAVDEFLELIGDTAVRGQIRVCFIELIEQVYGP